MAGQRSSVNEEKRPSPILDHHGTSWETPWGYTHSIHLSLVRHTTKHNNTSHSHYVWHMLALLDYVQIIDGKSALCQGGKQRKEVLIFLRKKNTGLKNCLTSLSFSGVTVKSSNWITAGVESKMQKECSFPAKIIWSPPCLNQLQL